MTVQSRVKTKIFVHKNKEEKAYVNQKKMYHCEVNKKTGNCNTKEQ